MLRKYKYPQIKNIRNRRTSYKSFQYRKQKLHITIIPSFFNNILYTYIVIIHTFTPTSMLK